MKLSNEQRLLVYKELLKVVCKDPSVDWGMCVYLSSLLDNSDKMPKRWRYCGGAFKMGCLPELEKYKEDSLFLKNLSYWAPLTKKGWETRIGWIEQAIIDVKKLIK
jgi:hypothetical protein